MGCFHPKTSARLYPSHEDEMKLPPRKYVHYLAEEPLQWQLVLYCVEDRKFLTFKLSSESLVPACESVIIRNTLYCTGGIERCNTGQSTCCLLAVQFFQKECCVFPFASMFTARCRHGVTTVGERTICVAGGFESDEKMLAKAEVFDIKKGEWSDAGSLVYPRIDMTACSFGDQYVYIFGGRTKNKEKMVELNIIEYLDITQENKVWISINCGDFYLGPDPSKLWCIQTDEKEIILFGSEKTAIFNIVSTKVELVNDEEQRFVPDKRCEIKRHGDEINMILEAVGNVGVYSVSTRKWSVQPHIVLGL